MITAKIVADSISQAGKRITTFELEYPRFIHSEMLTHRMISKNSASSRAIPFSKFVETITENPALPVFWGKNQAGMQAAEELSDTEPCDEFVFLHSDGEYRSDGPSKKERAKQIWLEARDSAIEFAKKLSDLGLHKQIVNRILEPWFNIKIVATATNWDNFFHLRCHNDAQPEIHALASLMLERYSNNTPEPLKKGEWHLPYVDDFTLTLEDSLKVSASLCAQTSYRKSDESIEKAIIIYDRLVNSTPVHASPFEHQATPLDDPNEQSGNFRGWLQYRQTIPGNVCEKFSLTS